MKIEFIVDFDGTLDIQPGDSLELQILEHTGNGHVYEHPENYPAQLLAFRQVNSTYTARIVRQTGVRPSPPDLGVNVSDDAGISDRVG